MSMKIFRLSSFLFALVFVAAAFCFDVRVSAGNALAQNANSSTTMSENANTATTHRKRGRRHKAPATDSTAAPAAEASGSTAPAASPAASADVTEQTDLSGTYTGTFDCSDAGLSGETTLTITGNQFTTSDGKSGRITAATTRGYTAVAMQFGELAPATAAQPSAAPVIVSMRAKKSRDRLTLTSVPGTTHVCSFTPAGSRAARTRRASRPAASAQPAVTAEPVAAPATAPAEPTASPGAEAGPMPPTTASPARRGRRGSRTPTTPNTNTNANSNPTTPTTPADEGAKPKPSPTPN